MLIVAVMLLVNVDVIGRNLFNKPVPGVPELVTLSVVAIVFLQVAYAFQRGYLTRTVVLLAYIEKRSLRVRALLELLLSLLASAVVIELLLASWPLFLKAWVRNTYEGTIGSFTVVQWPVKMIILAGSSVLLAHLFLRALQSAYAFWYRVPLNGITHDQP